MFGLTSQSDEPLPGALGSAGPEPLALGAEPLDRGGAPAALYASGEEHPHGVTPY